MSRFLRCLLAVLVCLALCIPVLLNPVLADEETTAEPTEEDNTEDALTPAVEEAEELLPVIEETEEVNEVSEESGSIDPEVEHDLQEDEYYHGEIDLGQTLWFSFTPTMSDSYDFHFDVFPGATVTLYDQDDEQVATVYHDDFIAEMTAELTADVKYYIEVTNGDNGCGSYNINVRRTPVITVEAVGDTDFEVNYGSPVRLEVNASSRLGTELTYFWSSSDSGIVPEECNSNVLEIDEITKTTWFYCTVSDEYNNYVSESFVVRTNRFSATADSPATQYVAAGSSADLKVKLSGDDLSKVEYSWYFREFESEDDWPEYTYMEEADQNTIHIDNIQKRQEYFCEIRDGYGNTTSVYFYIYVADSIQTLSLNDSKTVNFNGSNEKYVFNITVPEDGHYIIHGQATGDSYIELHSKEECITNIYMSAEYDNAIDVELLSDEQYYLVVFGSDPSFKGSVTVKYLTPITVTFDAGSQGYFYGENDEKQQTFNRYLLPGERIWSEVPETYADNVEFDGWYTDPELTHRFDFYEAAQFTEDTTLYAKYIECFRLVLHAGEGRVFGDGNETVVNLYRESFNLQYVGYPHVSGFAVAEWYDNPELSGDPVDKTRRFSEDVEVYAKWVPSVKVTFDAGEGYFRDNYDGTYERKNIIEDAAGTTVYVQVPQHNSKVFDGWYESQNFAPGTEMKTENGRFVLSETTTYYAKYTTGCKVTYNANGGTFAEYFNPQMMLAKGSVFRYVTGVVSHSNPNKVFFGWSLTKDGKQKIDRDYTVTKDITVYAVWADAVNLKLVANGVKFYLNAQPEPLLDTATLKVAKDDVFANVTSTFSPQVLNEDMYLEGWYTDSAFRNRVDPGSYKITKNTTLYAKLQPRPENTGYSIAVRYPISYGNGIGIYSVPADVGKTNYLYYPRDRYVDLWLEGVPQKSFLKDIGTTRVTDGTNVEFLTRYCVDANDRGYPNPGTEKITAVQYEYLINSLGSSTVELTVDGETTTFVITAPSKQFTDVNSPTQYYYNAVYWAVDKGITQGNSPTTFNPGGFCKRYQFVLFLWRQAGCPEPTETEDPFTDVLSDPKKDVYEKAVLWAKEKEITTGTTPTTFDPYAPLTRGQVVTFLHRAAGKPEVTTTTNPFKDLDSSKYYYKPVLWAVENGITTGLNATQFGPTKTCTRGQTVLFMYRLFRDQQTVSESNH